MDKFTVDLDQVLNDFEYSELTDQYSNVRNPIDASNTVNHNNVTKHSINNVFHSLNEYLNTSIDLPSTNNVESNVKAVENVDKGNGGHSYNRKKNEECAKNPEINVKEEIEKKPNNSAATTEANRDIKIGAPVTSTIQSPSNDATFTVTILDPEKATDHSEESEDTESKTDDDDTSTSKEDTSKDEDISDSSSKEESSSSAEVPFSKEDTSSKIETNPTEDILIELDISAASDIVENLKKDADGENLRLNNEAADILEEKSVDQELLKDKIVDIRDEDKCVNIEEKANVNMKIELVEEAPVNEEKEEVEDETVNKEKEKMNKGSVSEIFEAVGFQAVTDIHDDEIEVLLAELENDKDLIKEGLQSDVQTVGNKNDDEEEISKAQENKDIIANSNIVTDEEEIVVEELKEAESTVPESIPSVPTVVSEDIPKINTKECSELVEKIATIDIADVKEIPDKDKDCKVTEIKSDDSLLNKSERSLEVEEAVLQKEQMAAKQENIPEVEAVKPAVTECIKEDLVRKEECETKTEDKESSDIKYERQDSASRPQHLPLNEEEIEKQREINLIGAPGSTPFNNVYISNEIGKKEHDNDSITSTGSSTFSDTGSTASTASTEEIRDDNDEVTPRVERTVPVENLAVEPKEPSDEGPAAGCVEEISEPNPVEEESEVGASGDVGASTNLAERQWLGKEAPLWIPDSDTASCLHCDMKFTVLKRRHHCRACGLVLCSKCCHLRFKLEYLDAEARVCNKCHDILNKDTNSSSSSDLSPDHGTSSMRRPNPNNPLEYCSTISPLQQVSGAPANPLPAVMVPVGVLKRKGSNKAKSNKSVMFCDGIRPGSDLTNLDNDFNYNNTKTKKLEKTSTTAGKINRNLPLMDSETNSFIPKSENSLPPLVTITKTDISYTDCLNNPTTVELLKNNQLTFAILLSLYVHVKIINMNCCINKMAWCFSTEGLINVGQDEIVIILEYIDEESFVPKDIFYHINNVYADAVKGTSVKELGLSLHNSSNFLDSKNHAGFVYIRPTLQCLENVIKPKEPFLIGILIHRWETPWAKLFPLRLILRLGAEYRYYPSPVISTRHRDSVFVEIGHTIINLLADFRNFSYTLPQINGLIIHMEDKNTTVTIPVNRYDQVIKSINNSSDHILAFAGTFSQEADSHLVCIQDTQGNENCYSTHAINIQNKPRKLTGASFIVFNGALKSSSGLTAKSNIVEDGLMIQVLPEHMQQIRDNLRAMKNHTIPCGCVNADSDETVSIVWGENDVNFNIGVTSAIDGMALNGIPSIRVHNGKNYCANGNRIIRWTEVFIIQNGEDSPKNQDPVDVSRISEGIAKATCDALLNYLDLLVTNNFQKIGIRTTLQMDSVSYCAGSNNTKLPPIYMKSLDNELIPVLHRIASNNIGENAVILELVFRILNV